MIEALEDSNNVMSDTIISKLEKLQKDSTIKRYSMRSTDWLSEAGKKRNRSREIYKGDIF